MVKLAWESAAALVLTGCLVITGALVVTVKVTALEYTVPLELLTRQRYCQPFMS